jgi:hypothetical protein
MLPLLVCISGIFLGLFFKVLILFPVSLIGSAILIFVDVASGASAYAIMGDLSFAFISLQGGYMLGLTGRDACGNILARLHAIQSNRI